MKKLIAKSALLIVLVLCCTLIINTIYVNNAGYGDDIDKFKTVPYDITICNFGSSHGRYGFNYSDVSDEYNCFNFAMSSQSLSYDDRILNTYKDHLKDNDCIVFITVSYFSLYGKPETEADDFDSKNMRYYSILPKNEIKDWNMKSFIIAKYPSLTAYQALPYNLFMQREESRDAYWNGCATDIDIEKDALEACERHLVKNKRDKNGNLIDNKEEKTALLDMIRICRSKGDTPVFITTPYLEEYNDAIDKKYPDFFDKFSKDVTSLATQNDVEYLDYSHDERFTQDKDAFMNSDHLNRKGAKKFTNVVLGKIKQ